jgi:PncC family amidohydrolase
MFFNSTLKSSATKILELLRTKNLKLTCAESCTGGLLSALFTSISGSSDVFERGFVTYSNQSKIEMLSVKEKTLKYFGAVSEEVAKEMALGALKNSKADIAIAITGIAGPKSDDTEKPVGLVYIAVATKEKIQVRKFNFSGDRDEVRKAGVVSALNFIQDLY